MNTQLRYTTLTSLGNTGNGNWASFFSQTSGMEQNYTGGGQIGIDEVVFSPAGVLATIQDPPSLSQMLNDNSSGAACSFVL